MYSRTEKDMAELNLYCKKRNCLSSLVPGLLFIPKMKKVDSLIQPAINLRINEGHVLHHDNQKQKTINNKPYPLTFR